MKYRIKGRLLAAGIALAVAVTAFGTDVPLSRRTVRAAEGENPEAAEEAKTVEEKPSEEVKPAEEPKPEEKAETAEEAKPMEKAETAEEAKPADKAQSAEEAKPGEEAKSAEEGEPAEEAKSAGEVKPDGTLKGAGEAETENETFEKTEEGKTEVSEAASQGAENAEGETAAEAPADVEQGSEPAKNEGDAGIGDGENGSGEGGNSGIGTGEGGTGTSGSGEGENSGTGSGNSGATLSGSLSGLDVKEDGQGKGGLVTFTYTNVNNTDSTALTYGLVDESGSYAGTPVSLTVGGQYHISTYFLQPGINLFNVDLSDFGKNLYLKVTAKTAEGVSETQTSDSYIVLTNPSLTIPSGVAYSAVSTFADFTDPGKVKGLVYVPGSIGCVFTVVRLSDGAELPISTEVTAESTGSWRIRMSTVLGDFYSNDFEIVVPVTDITVTGDEVIGSTFHVAVSDDYGVASTGAVYSWSYGEDGEEVSAADTYTASLEDVVNAASLTLRVKVTDQIGNVRTHVMALEPFDLTKADLTLVPEETLTYSGLSQIPADGALMLGDYRIPLSLYTASEPDGKNTTKAGEAWMRVTGLAPYLTGWQDVSYTIQPAKKNSGSSHTKKRTGSSGTNSKTDSSGSKSKEGAAGDAQEYTDGTVTGADGTPLMYSVRVESAYEADTEGQTAENGTEDAEGTDGEGNAQAAVSVFRIEAKPDTDAAGKTLTDDAGNALYSQRNLHVTPGFMTRVENAGCSVIRFAVADAAVDIPTETFRGKAGYHYTLRVAPLKNADLTEEEQTALAGYETAGMYYAFRLVNENAAGGARTWTAEETGTAAGDESKSEGEETAASPETPSEGGETAVSSELPTMPEGSSVYIRLPEGAKASVSTSDSSGVQMICLVEDRRSEDRTVSSVSESDRRVTSADGTEYLAADVTSCGIFGLALNES